MQFSTGYWTLNGCFCLKCILFRREPSRFVREHRSKLDLMLAMCDHEVFQIRILLNAVNPITKSWRQKRMIYEHIWCTATVTRAHSGNANANNEPGKEIKQTIRNVCNNKQTHIPYSSKRTIILYRLIFRISNRSNVDVRRRFVYLQSQIKSST